MAKYHLSEVTRVVFIEEDSVMVLTSCITSTSRVRSVLSYTTMTCRDVTSLLSIFTETGRHE